MCWAGLYLFFIHGDPFGLSFNLFEAFWSKEMGQNFGNASANWGEIEWIFAPVV